MNRASIVQAIAACDALGSELRKQLKADAAAEYAEQGTAPTWRMPGYTVSAALTADAVLVADEVAWLRYVEARYPTEVEEIRRVRSAWQADFLCRLARTGEAVDDEGTVIPGLEFVPGGEFKTVSILPQSATRAALRRVAAEIASGRRPLGLPSTVAQDGDETA